MMWGAIRSDCGRVLLQCHQNVNQTYYQQLLDKGITKIYTTRHLLKQDSATYHTAYLIVDYLGNKYVWLLKDWAQQSADLFPIKKIVVHSKIANV